MQEDLAKEMAVKAHYGQLDKGGRPYIEHPAYVAAMMDDDTCRAVAWLHDVVEDTTVTLEYIEAVGFSSEVIAAVDALTHRVGESYSDYLSRVAHNPIARKVKLADLEHNKDLSRLNAVTEEDLYRHQKYEEAIASLSE